MASVINKSDEELSWHLEGNWAPVFDEIDSDDLMVKGETPDCLNGQYIRSGMNPRSGYSGHWFFGNGMLHSLWLENGRVRCEDDTGTGRD